MVRRIEEYLVNQHPGFIGGRDREVDRLQARDTPLRQLERNLIAGPAVGGQLYRGRRQGLPGCLRFRSESSTSLPPLTGLA